MRTPNEWAKNERVMPQGSPEPGPVRPERNPYLIEVAEEFVNPKSKRVTFITGTQAGKSFLQENVIGQRIDDDPCPIIYFAPTESNINKKVEPVMRAMILQSNSLSRKFDKDHSTQHVKRVGAAVLYLSWMGSTTETASTSARLIMIDELDRCSKNAEGDVVELGEARGDAYADSRVGITATPTRGRVKKEKHPETGFYHWEVAGQEFVKSPTWREWQQGTRREWAVPCPHCKQYFIPWSGLLWWPGKGTSKECSPEEAGRKAVLICPNCGSEIEDKYRQSMNAKGVYVAPGQSVNKSGEVVGVSETEGNSYKSLWCSGLCSFSPKKTYGFLARKLLSALKSGDPDKLLAVFNTGFGECYAQIGEAPSWESVKAMSWRYLPGTVLPGFSLLLATVDVQKNRLVYVVRAWFSGMSSQLVENGELWGNTDKPDVWNDLGDLLEKNWNGYEIDLMGVDSGYRPDDVFNFVRQYKSRVRALRGDNLDKPFRMVKLDVDSRGKIRRHGDARWDFDSPRAKSWVHSRIGRSFDSPEFWVLPAGIDEDYCKQIVGEEYNEETDEWNRKSDNHYLDCEAMQYMLARMKGLDRKSSNVTLKDICDAGDAENKETELTDKTGKKKSITVKKSSERKSMAELGRMMGNE